MRIRLLLQPAVERSRSMLLYAERLAAVYPGPDSLELFRLPGLPGRLGGIAADLAAPPLALPRLDQGIAHIIDHACAGYARFLRIPSLVTVHDLIPLKAMLELYPTGARTVVTRKTRLWFRWNIEAVRHADLVVTPSQATAEDVQRLLGVSRVHVVPHGVDDDFFQPASEAARERVRQRLGQRLSGPLLLQVSNSFFYKNDHNVEHAMRLLLQRYPELHWVRVGSPPTAAARQLGCFHYDRAGLDELIALYGQASLLLFPSWDEGFGWPPLEAMAAGCPVVSTDRGSLAETAAPAAMLVDPADPDDIAAGVGRVLEDATLAQQLRIRGRSHAGRYCWRESAAKMARLYQEAARCR